MDFSITNSLEQITDINIPYKKIMDFSIINKNNCDIENNLVKFENFNVYEEKIVSDYCNIPIFEVFELEVFDFWYLLRDAAIYLYSQTEDGKKYLDNCWRIEQTQPDKEKLRAKFGKGE